MAVKPILSNDEKHEIENTLDSIFSSRLKNALTSLFVGADKQAWQTSIDPAETFQLKVNYPENSDAVDVMRSKDGKPIISLVNSKGKIVGTATIDLTKAAETAVSVAAPEIGLAMKAVNVLHNDNIRIQKQLKTLQLQNVAIMKQLMQIANVVIDIRERMIELQELHDDDLRGRLTGMRDSLLQIARTNNADLREKLIANVITACNEVRGIAKEEMRTVLQKMPNVPKSAFRRWADIAIKNDFVNDVESSYSRVDYLSKLYLDATVILSYAYAFSDESEANRAVFEFDSEVLKPELLNKMVNAELILTGIPSDTWYKTPEIYFGRMAKEAKCLYSQNTKEMAINVSGNMLLEALIDE